MKVFVLLRRIFVHISFVIGSIFLRRPEDWPNLIRWLVRTNNKCTYSIIKGRPLKSVLLLLPHCMQIDKCIFRLTGAINNCKKCGGCQIGDIISIAETVNIRLRVVNGGTQARMIIKNEQPDIVVAIACERDLLEGIREIYPLLVIGILNQRPSGPCYNTIVDIENLKQELANLGRQVDVL